MEIDSAEKYSEQAMPLENDKEERKKTFEAFRVEIWKREVSNSEKFDNAMLTYSSAGLALSLTFLKDFIPLSQANNKVFLYLSWALFVVVVISTIASYFISNKGLSEQLNRAEDYYINCNEDAFLSKNIFEQYTDYSAYISGCCFILAVSFNAMFVFCNLKGAEIMNEQKWAATGTSIPKLNKMQSEPDKKGQPIPPLQKAPSPQPQPQPNSQQ